MSFSISLEILYHDDQADRFVCFNHAVKLAMEGTTIDPQVDETDSEYDMRNLSCYVCEAEEIKREQAAEEPDIEEPDEEEDG